MKVFISYRRIDTEDIVSLIYDRVSLHFGKSSVFLDVDSIQIGIDFRQVLAEAVGGCDVLLALVGDRWLNVTDEAGRRRVDREDDYVRVEIECALRRGIPTIPVLVGNATMPNAEQLPSSLREFAFKNGMHISPGLDFERDLTRIIRSLESHRSIGWVECVNCCETVIPMADGTCPACRRDAMHAPDSAEVAQEGGGWVMMRIQEDARLPAICCSCARSTERLVKISRSHRVGGESAFVRIMLLLAGSFIGSFIGTVLSIENMRREIKSNVRSVVLRIPHCKVCSSKQSLTPVYVDFERSTMKFLVHREFRRQCKELL